MTTLKARLSEGDPAAESRALRRRRRRRCGGWSWPRRRAGGGTGVVGSVARRRGAHRGDDRRRLVRRPACGRPRTSHRADCARGARAGRRAAAAAVLDARGDAHHLGIRLGIPTERDHAMNRVATAARSPCSASPRCRRPAAGTGAATEQRPGSPERSRPSLRRRRASRRASASCSCSAICRAGSTQDNVPPAARKALTDMKEFLPYKSYRLLDVQWTLCCGGGRGPRRS